MTDIETEEVTGDEHLAALERLEKKVERALEAVSRMREERNGLRARTAEQEGEIRRLTGELTGSRETGEEIARLERERDELLRDRAATARRIETILERLDGLGLE